MAVATLALSFALAFFSGERAAHAAKLVIVNTDDDIIELGNVWHATDGAEELEGMQLGYRYDRFGVFWVDLFRWDGEFVVYTGDQYAPLTEKQLAALPPHDVPLAYRFRPD